MRSFFRKLLYMKRRRQKEAELEEELRFHLDEETTERQEHGRSHEQAAHEARLSVGNLASPDSMRAAIQGTNTVFLVNVGPEIPERDRVAATISKDLGVQKIVKLSSLDV